MKKLLIIAIIGMYFLNYATSLSFTQPTIQSASEVDYPDTVNPKK